MTTLMAPHQLEKVKVSSVNISISLLIYPSLSLPGFDFAIGFLFFFFFFPFFSFLFSFFRLSQWRSLGTNLIYVGVNPLLSISHPVLINDDFKLEKNELLKDIYRNE